MRFFVRLSSQTEMNSSAISGDVKIILRITVLLVMK